MPVAEHEHFAYHQSMHVGPVSDATVSGIAAAIGEPARANMLYCLLDGRARTSTELAVVADVTASTASVHLQRLKTLRLVKVFAQGKHRYYSLEGDNVAAALEALSVLRRGTSNRIRAEYAKSAARCTHLLRSHRRHLGRLAARALPRIGLAVSPFVVPFVVPFNVRFNQRQCVRPHPDRNKGV
jgi:DNA-binding transcriptional ArsR family regulator